MGKSKSVRAKRVYRKRRKLRLIIRKRTPLQVALADIAMYKRANNDLEQGNLSYRKELNGVNALLVSHQVEIKWLRQLVQSLEAKIGKGVTVTNA